MVKHHKGYSILSSGPMQLHKSHSSLRAHSGLSQMKKPFNQHTFDYRTKMNKA